MTRTSLIRQMRECSHLLYDAKKACAEAESRLDTLIADIDLLPCGDHTAETMAAIELQAADAAGEFDESPD